ncbi:hypothetical protein EDB89DRAFT_2110949 [Lactarius sanguifluus]|nr:hypothetical protein EDB89DRAFT_2110949 [Lactarius sanguifluus]
MLSTVIIQTLSLFFITAAHASSVTDAQDSWSITGPFTNTLRVPVILGVMSRCPDALLCETLFDKVIPKVAEKIDLSLTFIARLNSSDSEFGVTCRHGRDECAGNVQQLCAAKIGSPDVALKCARTAKIDWSDSEVGRCAGEDGSGTGEEGVRLLQESTKVTEALGIIKSCTIVINGEKVCVHDGTWKDCENGHEITDFIRQIESEYRKLNGR